MSDKPNDAEASDIGGQASATNGLSDATNGLSDKKNFSRLFLRFAIFGFLGGFFTF
jgi:hypothetical protein